jgi:hypothetical protein
MINIKKNFWGVLFLLIIIFNGFCIAQAKKDSLVYKKQITKSPTSAIIQSALLPGLGQLYNGKLFKAILVLGGEIALGGNAVYYNQYQVQSSSTDEWEFYRNLKSRFLWWLFAVHLLNVIDAYVDASLSGFDTGPDLSRSFEGTSFYTLVSFKIGL